MKRKPFMLIDVFISAAITAHSASASPAQQAYVKASNTGTNLNPIYSDFFGKSVAVSGDTVVVGRFGDE